MSIQTIRFRTDAEHVPAVVDPIAALFGADGAEAPAQLHDIAMRETDEPVSTLILKVSDGEGNPVPSFPVAAAFRGWLPTLTDEDLMPRPYVVPGRNDA